MRKNRVAWRYFVRGLFGFFFLVMMSGCLTASKNMAKLSSSDVDERRAAVVELGIMGPKAKAAINDLIEISIKDNDEEVRRLAIEALGCIAPAMTVELNNALILAMNDQNVHIRRAALVALGNFSNFPPNIITILQKHLTDPDQIVRELVMSAFERIGKLGVRDLIRALNDQNEQMRLSAVVTLKRLGDNALPAVDALKCVLGSDACQDVRAAAEVTLRIISED